MLNKVKCTISVMMYALLLYNGSNKKIETTMAERADGVQPGLAAAVYCAVAV